MTIKKDPLPDPKTNEDPKPDPQPEHKDPVSPKPDPETSSPSPSTSDSDSGSTTKTKPSESQDFEKKNQQREREENPWSKERKRFSTFSTPVISKRISLILCNLGAVTGKTKHCQTQYIAESVDLMYVVCPIYTFGKKFDFLLYQLHVQFQGYMKSFGIPFVTFEAIKYQSNEKYLLTKPNNEPYEMQGYYRNISYVRENLLNIAIQRLNKTVEWEYVAWIDAHHVFDNPFWWEDAIYKSDHYMMVQLFADSIRWDMRNRTIRYRAGFVQTSFLMSDMNQVKVQIEFGNAHILSRESYEKIGYIHDECFASGCDWAYMQASLSNEAWFTMEPAWPRYNHTHQEWLNRVKPIVNGSRAYIPGKIFHLDHKSTFSYIQLRNILERSDYNLKKDFKRDENGVFYLSNQRLAKIIEFFYLSHY